MSGETNGAAGGLWPDDVVAGAARALEADLHRRDDAAEAVPDDPSETIAILATVVLNAPGAAAIYHPFLYCELHKLGPPGPGRVPRVVRLHTRARGGRPWRVT